MKTVAFDLHGVLDSYEEFRNMFHVFKNSRKYRVVIISGSLFTQEVQKVLELYELIPDRYYSITENIMKTEPDKLTWKEGQPFAPDSLWDIQKALICQENRIDMLFDDSPTYGQYFDKIKTLYIQVHNGTWKESGRR